MSSVSLPHGVNALIVRDGKILACQRKTSSLWGYPGGKVDTGESPLMAIVREVEEETGILLKDEACVFFYEGICLNKDPADRPYWVYSFLCKLQDSQEPKVMQGEPPFAWLFPAEFLKLSAFPEFNELTLALAMGYASHAQTDQI